MSSAEHFGSLSGLRGNERQTHLDNGAVLLKSAQDSIEKTNGGSKRRYVTTRGAQAIAAQLSNHDRRLLETLSIVHLATGQQLQHLLHGEGSTAARESRRQLRRLSDLQVLTRLERRPGGVRGGSLGYVYVLDIVGQIITGIPARRRHPRLPSLAFVAHAVAVTDCYLKLKDMETDGRIELLAFDAEPGCWRSFVGIGGYRRVLKPDAFVITAQGDWEDRWLLEIDRSTENMQRLRTKALTHVAYYQSGKEQAAYGITPRVLWVVPDEQRRSQLLDVLAELPAEHWTLFAVCTDHNFTDTITQGAATPNHPEDSQPPTTNREEEPL